MLTSSPLPPRGVFVPTAMLFHSQLPSAVLLTWIQLRALAWQGWSTPPLSLAEFASLLAIHPARLSRHLDQLQSLSALSVHPNGAEKLVLSFPEEPFVEPGPPNVRSYDPTTPVSTAREDAAPEPTSYFPRQILGYITYDEDVEQYRGLHQSKQVNNEPAESLIKVDKLPSLCTREIV